MESELQPPSAISVLAGTPTAPRRLAQVWRSRCQPSSGIVGPNAKTGAVDAHEVLVSFVNHVYVETGQNLSETARRTGLDRKTVRQKLDLARLARWRERGSKRPDAQ